MTGAQTAEVARVPRLVLAAAAAATIAAAEPSKPASETVWGERTRSVQVVGDTSATAAAIWWASEIEDGSSVAAATSASLHRLLSSPVGALALRIDALGELATRRDPDLAEMIANRLGNSRLNPAWRVALVHCAESVACSGVELRASLAAGLFRSALVFRDEKGTWSDPPLWAAVRTLGGLIDASQTGVLLEFLSADRLPTRQVALQALQSILRRDSAAAAILPNEIRARVAGLAKLWLNADWLISGENIALAANAYCAAALACVPELEMLDQQLREVARPALERQIRLAKARAGVETGDRVAGC